MDARDWAGQVDAIVARLHKAHWKEREAIKEELLAVARENAGSAVREHLEGLLKGLPLEVRWEVEEVIEAVRPPPAPEPEPEEEPEEEASGELTAADLKIVYDDPRGITIHVDKTGRRWFLTQPHPHTGQPTTFELSPPEVEQVRAQLARSPYWVLGSGVAGGR